MDGILPTQGVTNSQPQMQQQQQFGLEAQMLTAKIQANLPLGTTLLAQVLGNDKNGNLIVRANGSDLLLSSPLALVKGAQLQIRLDAVSGNIQAQVLSVDGKLPAGQPQKIENPSQRNPQEAPPTMKLLQTLPAGAAKIAEPQTAGIQAPRVDSVNLTSTPNAMLKGMVIQPSPEIMQGIRATMALSPQSEEKLIKNLPSELKAGSGADVKITGIISQPKSAPTPQPQPGSERIDTSNRTLKGQDWMKTDALKPEWIQNFSPTMKAAPSGNLQLNAMVVENRPDGEMTVETKIGLVRIEGKATPFPKGTEITIEIAGFRKAPENSRPQNPLQEMGKEWPNLKNAFHENKAEAAKIAGSEHNFGAKLVSFINAVKSGDAESWLGAEFLESMDGLTRNTLVNKLNADLTNLRGLMTDNTSNWQTVLFPIFDGQELNQARLHVRNFKEETGSIFDVIGTRFVVELETSRYGEMQFDGLVRHLAPKKSFDLIIRTFAKLDQLTQGEIRQIFGDTQAISGFAGSIDFAVNPHFPTEPWRDFINKKGSHDSVIG